MAVRSKPQKSPWGALKTRVALNSTRTLKAVSRGRCGDLRRSPIPMRLFDARMERLFQSS